MPAARGVKRTASKAEAKPAAGSSKIKKKLEAKSPLLSGELKANTRKGQVFTTGQGEVGQLGLGENCVEKIRFTHVKELPSNIVDICAGGMHTVVLDKDGNVWTFGCNDEGALGRDTEAPNSEWQPKRVTLPGRAVRISAGDSHSAALLQNQQVFAWGSFRDSHGNMGLTLKGNERTPIEMLPGHRVVQIASGVDHLVMLTDMGQVFTCGCGEQGQLGRVTARSCDRHSRLGLNGLLVPAPLVFCRDKADFEAVWAGSHCTFARKAAKGDIYVWGLNNYFQIGVKKGSPQTVFAPVVSETFSAVDGEWSCIAAGQHHTLALDDAGRCYALGRKEYGRLGLGEACEDAKELILVPGLEGKRCVSISCGPATSFAVTDAGEVLSWGMGTSGQLGTGEDKDEVEPRLLSKGELEGRTALRVSAGGQHTVLLVASQDEAEDEVEEAEKADTAPHTKAEDTPMEVDADADAQEGPSKKVKEEEKKPAGRKAPAKRGRRGSASSTEVKPQPKKQNGGSPVAEETAEEVKAEEKASAEAVEEPSKEEKAKSGDSEADSANPPSQPKEEEKKPVAAEGGAEKRSATDDSEEPQSKRTKLDVDKPAVGESKPSDISPPAIAEPEPCQDQEMADIEDKKPVTESNKAETETKKAEIDSTTAEPVAEEAKVEEKLANGNGSSEEDLEQPKEEVSVDVEMKPAPAVVEKEEAKEGSAAVAEAAVPAS